jgi:hypothetical protein
MTTILAQTTTSQPTSQATQALDLHGSQALGFLIIISLVLVVVWFVPVFLDARRAYHLRRDVIGFLHADLIPQVTRNGLTLTELRTLLRTIGEPATGQRALARSLMALTITTIVGVVAVALLLSSATDVVDLRKTVLTALLSILGVVVGFYFGSRSVESAVAGTSEPAPAAGGQQAPPAGPVLRVLTPSGPTTLSKDDQGAWNPVPIRLQHPTGEIVLHAISGDSAASLQGDPPAFEYRPDNPDPVVTILFWLRDRPEATARVDLQRPSA